MTAALHNPHGTAFGLMDEVYGPGTAAALRDSGGPWEVFYHDGLWTLATAPTWHVAAAYRLKPQPSKPREWWIHYDYDVVLKYIPDEDGQFKANGYIHVREVIE